MDTILEIAKLTEKIAVSYPLGPVIILASLYFIHDGYKTASAAQIVYAAIALLWSLFTVYAVIIK
jgi:hypothetical protein